LRFAVLGTGSVGRTLAAKLEELGHEVRVGSREAGEDKVPFAEAAEFGEVVINATAGRASLEALGAAGAENLGGKVLIDVSNPLDFSGDGPPTLSVSNDDSLAERIQRALPDTRVVKALNTVNAAVMVNPSGLGESSTIFVCGDDPDAKRQVAELLESFGWLADDIVDLGDITAARGAEMYLPLWLRMTGALGSPQFNIRIVRPE
jgi:predicted dinucleotide-binding enzyme